MDSSDLHSKKIFVVSSESGKSGHCADSQNFHLFSHFPTPQIPTENLIAFLG